MSDINLYTLSNKIRTILLIAIDNEIFASSKKNHLLINSQSEEQLTKKFVNYRDFIIESEESFEGEKNNEDNNIFDFRCNYSHNKFNFYCYSSKASSEYLYSKNFITKSLPPKKNNADSHIKKITKAKMSESNFCKLKIDSGKKSIPQIKSSFSCNEIVDFKNSLSLSQKSKYLKKFSADLYIYSVDNKNDDSTKLLNYCYKLKKPNDEIINEISDDDTSTNKDNKKNFLFPQRIKNSHRNIPKKKLKKIINKKKIYNKNNNNNDDHLLIYPTKKNSIDFTNEMKLYFDVVEKSNPKEKIKIQHIGQKESINEIKKTETFQGKNILQLHYYSKSPEKKSKIKKFEQLKKPFCIQAINKKPVNKKYRYFKSIDNDPIILKHKKKKEKSEKNDVSISDSIASDKQFQRKHSKSSKTLCKKDDKLKQNGISCFGKKISRNNVDKRNGSVRNERKIIIVSNANYNNRNSHRIESIGNKQN